MIWLPLLFLILRLLVVPSRPEMIKPGPDSGIALEGQSDLLITDCRLHTQRVFVRLNPRDVCRKHMSSTAHLTSWTRKVINHAKADITHMLQQLEKFTITQSELAGHQRCNKRFIGGILAAAIMVGSLFSLGMSTYNTVSMSTVKRHIGELQSEIPQIRSQINQQQQQLETSSR